MAPSTPWLLVDKVRDIDQKAWLCDYISREINRTDKHIIAFSKEVAAAFDEQFPITIPARKLDKYRRFVRYETEEETLARCGDRSKKCARWVLNHKHKFLGSKDVPEQLVPRKRVRAKSIRDLFILAYPEVGAKARKDAEKRGITDEKVIVAEVDMAYTKALAEATKEQLEEVRNRCPKKEVRKPGAKDLEMRVSQQDRAHSDSTPESTRNVEMDGLVDTYRNILSRASPHPSTEATAQSVLAGSAHQAPLTKEKERTPKRIYPDATDSGSEDDLSEHATKKTKWCGRESASEAESSSSDSMA